MHTRPVGAILAALATLALGAPATTAGEPPGPARVVAPALRLPGLDGTEHTLAQWQGRVLLVNFWASWCAPCQAEIRELVRWQDKYGPRGLQILGVGIDDERPLRNVQRSLGINYPVLVAEPEGSAVLLSAWRDTQRFVPYSVVVDREGRVVHRQWGEFDQETFDQVVLPLL